jgi:hypothetical protein
VQTGAVVQGNYIGTDATGTTSLPNRDGIFANGIGGLVIGGTEPGAGNVISGNGHIGINFNSSNNDVVQGNSIGTDLTGTHALGNTGGINGGTNVLIGGTAPGGGNLISGNQSFGVFGTANSLYQGNLIGTDTTGTHALPNGNGIIGGAGNIIGGAAPGARNIISGNLVSGVDLEGGANNFIQGNYIGTDIGGHVAVPNGGDGVFDRTTTNNVIGGTAPGAGNLIAGNEGAGIRFDGVNGTVVQGNFIGTDATGNVPLQNHGPFGNLYVNSAVTNVLIGGSNAAARNVVAGAIFLKGEPPATGITIQGNSIGVGADNHSSLPASFGVQIAGGSSNNLIGGRNPGEGNVIANAQVGILIDHYFNAPDATGNTIVGNSIFNIRHGSSFSAGGLGIDINRFVAGLGPDGPNPNVPGGSTTGNNLLQNYPVLGSVFSGASTRVTGTFNSDPSTSYTLDFYANTIANPSGYGEGKFYLGSGTVTTDASGNVGFDSATFTSPLGASSVGEFISATATDPAGNTSEFSLDVPTVSPIVPVTVTVVGGTFTFDGQPHGATSSSVTAAGGFTAIPALTYYVGTNTSGPGSPDAPVNAGIYTVVASFVGDANHDAGSASDLFIINKADALINPHNYAGIYDTQSHSASVDITGVGGTILAMNSVSRTNAGHDEAAASIFGLQNYNDVSGRATIDIGQALATVIVNSIFLTYDGQPHTASVTVTGVGGESATVSVTEANAGHYQASAALGDPENYSGPSSGTANLDIAKADAIFNILGYSVTYDGNPHAANGTATGVNGEELSILLNLSGTTHTDPANYLDLWSFAGNTNYKSTMGIVADTISFPTDGFSVQTQAALNTSKSGDIVATVRALGMYDQATLDLLASGSYAYRFVFTDSISTVTVTASVVAGSYLGAGDGDFALAYRNSGSSSPLSALVVSANTSASTAMAVRFSVEVNIDGNWFELGSETMKAFLSKK